MDTLKSIAGAGLNMRRPVNRPPSCPHPRWVWAILLLTCMAGAAEPGPVARSNASLFEQVLELNRVQEPELDLPAMRSAFSQLVANARKAVSGVESAREKIAALNRVLLAERKVSYISNKYWRDSTLAASLMRGQGNCLSTSTLYVLVGEELALPIRLVLLPEHAFVRWEAGPTRINIETTRGGIEVADELYLNRVAQTAPGDIKQLGWGESLDANGFMAALFQFAAIHRADENRLKEALALLERAEELQPNHPQRMLMHIRWASDLTGDREAARQKLTHLLDRHVLPPSLETSALLYFAEDLGAEGDHARERELLLKAFNRAPKSALVNVLQQLAFCHRALHDFRGAVRYMELVLALVAENDPARAEQLYNYAILLKNDGRLDAALATLHEALKINPESWNLQMLEAGFLVLDGQRAQGLALYAKIEPPRGDAEFFSIMQAWFFATTGERAKFYPLFSKALEEAKSVRILQWIDQDVDLDPYRNDEAFKDLLRKHRERLTGKAATPNPETPPRADERK